MGQSPLVERASGGIPHSSAPAGGETPSKEGEPMRADSTGDIFRISVSPRMRVKEDLLR